jgi:hypothetical protein
MSSNSVHAFDVWSVVHHLWGAYFGALLGFTAWEMLMVATAWELMENTPRGVALWVALGENNYTGDSAVNSVVDIVMTMTGWYVATLR